MKLMLIECDAEELRANRTVLDGIAEAIGSFTRALAGVDLPPDKLAEYMKKANTEKEEIQEEGENENINNKIN
ncbi:MAG: hypothetical protein J6S85_17425 [Methanobrevibacter sp.]|nr:hypothetical protein [Methanobrevibacter sp.]